MKICIAGKNNIAVETLQYLLHKLKVDTKSLLIITNETDDGKDNWQKSLLKYANENKLQITTLEKVKKIEDLFLLSLEFDRIIPIEEFKSKKLYNIHFSLLPKYKGMYTSVMPILFNEQESGVSLHCIDCGIDTGDIIAQIKFDILHKDTSRDLYFKCIKNGIRLVKENLCNLLNGEYMSYKQEINTSSYFSKSDLDFSNILINLNQTAISIHNQLRAFNFIEYQQPKVFGITIINSSILDKRSCARPGTILYEDNNKLVLSTIDYNIKLVKEKK